MKARLRSLLPGGVRWVPHDIPTQDQAPQKYKAHRHLFSLKPSSSSSDTQHGAPKHRKSAISLTSEPDPELDARTHAQRQSMFFAMLPLEIRQMVYDYVMGDETLHLTFSTKKRFGHFVCEGPQELDGRECGCRVLVGGRQSERLNGACARLLRTCRRMYSEAIPHLYRPHTFSLLHLTHLLYLPSSLPQPRLNTIRTLRLRWVIRALPYMRRGNKIAYREDTANWEKGWRILAEMQGLRDLYIALVDPSQHGMWERNWVELETELLEPVKQVTKPKWFDLTLPYASCDTRRNMGECRVVLSKPVGEEGESEEN